MAFSLRNRTRRWKVDSVVCRFGRIKTVRLGWWQGWRLQFRAAAQCPQAHAVNEVAVDGWPEAWPRRAVCAPGTLIALPFLSPRRFATGPAERPSTSDSDNGSSDDYRAVEAELNTYNILLVHPLCCPRCG